MKAAVRKVADEEHRSQSITVNGVKEFQDEKICLDCRPLIFQGRPQACCRFAAASLKRGQERAAGQTTRQEKGKKSEKIAKKV
jgi:hypothetical protein